MNEEERQRIAYLRAMGKENKAMNLERKYEQREIKKKYKEQKNKDKKPSLLKRLANKGKEVLNNVKEDVKDKVEEVKEIVKKKPPVEKPEVKKEVKPIVKEDKSFVGKGLNELDVSTKNSLSGAVGQAYEGGVGDVTKNGIVYKRGDEGYDLVAKELLAQKAAMDEREKKIIKKK